MRSAAGCSPAAQRAGAESVNRATIRPSRYRRVRPLTTRRASGQASDRPHQATHASRRGPKTITAGRPRSLRMARCYQAIRSPREGEGSREASLGQLSWGAREVRLTSGRPRGRREGCSFPLHNRGISFHRNLQAVGVLVAATDRARANAAQAKTVAARGASTTSTASINCTTPATRRQQ